MKLRAGRITRFARKPGRGFSLVELLLVVSLLLLLLGAVAFNFSTARRGAELDEGATQVESLIRYARAHAANTGRRVRITFEDDVGEGLLVPLGNLAVSWEPDPLGRPDQFQSLAETATYVNSILDTISIEDVRPIDTAPVPLAPSSAGIDAGAGIVEENRAFGFAPITFYPDGSSDSAEITIALRNPDGDDTRRMSIRLVGLTGSIRRRTLIEDAEPGSAAAATPSAGPSGQGIDR